MPSRVLRRGRVDPRPNMPLGGESGARLLRYQMLLITCSVHMGTDATHEIRLFRCCTFASCRICNRANQGGRCTPRCQSINPFARPAQASLGLCPTCSRPRPTHQDDVQSRIHCTTVIWQRGSCIRTQEVMGSTSRLTCLCGRLLTAGLENHPSYPPIRQPDMSLICNYC